MRSKFVRAKSAPGTDAGTLENRQLSQREKLEEAILNLATALGVSQVECLQARLGMIYRVPPDDFQSASNTIVSLSRRVAAKS